MYQKIRWLLLLMVMSLLPSVIVVANENVQDMAQYFPRNADVFVAVRTDEAYMLTLQDAVNGIITKLPAEAGVLPVDFIQLIDDMLAEEATSYEQVRAWLGDYVAFGSTRLLEMSAMGQASSGDISLMIAVGLRDAIAFEKFIIESVDANDALFTTEDDGSRVLIVADDDLQVTIREDVALFTTLGDLPAPDAPRLTENVDYSANISNLPADSYNILLHVNLMALRTALLEAPQEMAGLLLSTVPPAVTMGLTILDGRAFTIDIVQPIGGLDLVAISPVNPDFANRIPAETQWIAWSADFTAVFEEVVSQVSDFSTLDGGNRQDVRVPIRNALLFAGIDLDEDILAWTTGDYMVIGGVDVEAIFSAIVANRPNFESLPASFGLLIEATDAQLAQGFVDKLGAFLTRTLADLPSRPDDPQISITESDGVWSLTLTTPPLAPDAAPLEVVLQMGVADGMFYLSTADIAEVVRGQGASLRDDATYQYASRFFLPGSNTVVYTDDIGIIAPLALVAGLGVMGSPSDNLFDSFELPTRQRMAISSQGQGMEQAPGNPTAMIRMIYETARAIVHSTSITSVITPDDFSISRLVLILEP